MIGLRIQLNDQKAILAGKDDLCVLSTTVNVLGKIGENTNEAGVNKDRVFVSFSVSGLTDPIDGEKCHVRWEFMEPMKNGDKLTIEIIDGDEFDSPIEIEEAK